jgi:hypothetical protein
MLRLTRALLPITAMMLIVTAVAQARAAPLQTVRLRAQVPAAGSMSILTAELSIGGEGSHHHRQHLGLEMLNHRGTGVFGLGRLVAERGRPGRFLAVVEVFHRASALVAALPAGLDAMARTPPLLAARSADVLDEFLISAHNEHVIREVLKNNIVALAEGQNLGLDDFCDPLSLQRYLLGSAIIGAAYVLAGPVTGLPGNTTVEELADDAVHELCDDEEDYEEPGMPEDEEQFPGIVTLNGFLGTSLGSLPPPGYRVGLNASWAFEGPDEVRLLAAFTGTYILPGARTADSLHPIEAIKVVLPPAGSSPRGVTDFSCPTQLPVAAISSTSSTSDTLECSGGSLPLGQSFALNIQTSPPPSGGMGGELLAKQDGVYLAPFSISGP